MVYIVESVQQSNKKKYSTLILFFFILKIRNYESNIVSMIEEILGVPKFKMGDFFRMTVNMPNLNLNRECQIYHVDKIFRNFRQEIPPHKIKMNNYKYYYINRLSGRIGYETNEAKMIPVDDIEVNNTRNNLWI